MGTRSDLPPTCPHHLGRLLDPGHSNERLSDHHACPTLYPTRGAKKVRSPPSTGVALAEVQEGLTHPSQHHSNPAHDPDLRCVQLFANEILPPCRLLRRHFRLLRSVRHLILLRPHVPVHRAGPALAKAVF